MQFQNFFAEKLIINSTQDSEKISFNKKFLHKLQTYVYHVRKSVVTSKPLVHLKNATAINPWCCGNPAPFR